MENFFERVCKLWCYFSLTICLMPTPAQSLRTSQTCYCDGFSHLNNLYMLLREKTFFISRIDDNVNPKTSPTKLMTNEYNLDCFLYNPNRNIFPLTVDFANESPRGPTLHLQTAHTFKGTTIFLLDTSFIHHYFHLLENLIPVFAILTQRNIDPNSVQQIFVPLFPRDKMSDINMRLLKTLFPRSHLYFRDATNDVGDGKLAVFEEVISAHRGATLRDKSSISFIWNKMMASCAINTNLSLYNDALRTRLVSSMNLPTSPQIHFGDAGEGQDAGRRITLNVTIVQRSPSDREMTAESMSALESQLSALPSVSLRIRRIMLHMLPFQHQISIIAETNILIGTHGNGLSHLYWMTRPGVVVEIFPPNTFIADYQLLSAFAGHRHFAWDAKKGLFKGSEYLLSGQCRNASLYAPYGSVIGLPDYILSNVTDLVSAIETAVTAAEWPVSINDDKERLSKCRGVN